MKGDDEQIPLVNLFWKSFTEEKAKNVLVVRQQIKHGNVIEKRFENEKKTESVLFARSCCIRKLFNCNR